LLVELNHARSIQALAFPNEYNSSKANGQGREIR